MNNQRAPILVYHHVYPDEQARQTGPAPGVIGVSEFDRHMRWVREHDGYVVSTTAIVDWLVGRKPLPARACVLHFDNGWLDTFSVALPRLKEFGMTATCFPITSGIEAASSGESMRVRTLTEGSVKRPFMNWQQLGQLADAGWEIGAHTHTHCKVADKHDADGDDGVLREVEQSHRLFQQRLGSIPNHFAYPSGSRSPRTDALLRDQYRSLRLWRWDWPIQWRYTDNATSPNAIECQNIDSRVPFDQFERIFHEAADHPLRQSHEKGRP